MRKPFHLPKARGRIFGAWVCLVGAVMLWAPMLAASWAATWGTKVMDCCKGGICPMGMMHSKMRHTSPHKTMAEEAPMECEHHGKTGICNCSMSCGSQISRALTTPVIFVLPEPARGSQPFDAGKLSANIWPAAFEQSFEPPYPPPRTLVFSL